MVRKRSLKIIIFLLPSVLMSIHFFFPSHTIGAVSDVGIVVERAEQKESGKIDACGYCGKFINKGDIRSDAEKIVKEKLQQALAERSIGYREGKEKQPYISVLIYRFQERRGGNFAVDRPAGVGLHMHIIEGTVIGRTYVFDEDQKALSQNILGIGKFFRRGAKWITVEQLAEEAINSGIDYLLEVAR